MNLSVRRAALTVAGFALLAVGVALLVLPGPGLLLVLAGLVVLANEYPWASRKIKPVRRRALRAARESVASPLRITGSAVAGLGLVGAGIAWIVAPSLPFGGFATGSSLILSGLLLLGLLIYSGRRFRHREPAAAPTRSTVSTGRNLR